MAPSLGDLVLEALEKERLKNGAVVSGSTSSGVPEAAVVPNAFALGGDITPPVHTTEPEDFSSPSSPQRPRHRSQASFDWFSSGDSGSRSLRARRSLTSAGHGTSNDHDHATREGNSTDDDGELRGAFTVQDLLRGSRIVRQQSINDGVSASADKQRASSVPPKASSVSGGGGRSVTGKAKSTAHGKDGSTEWEDELRDSFNPAAADAKPKLGDRRISLWNHGRRQSQPIKGTESGTSTPDESGDGAQPKRPRPVRRATTAGWAAIRNRIKNKDPKAKDPNKSITGHQLITELTTGALPMVLLKMGIMDRDEHGDPRIPILMNYLKLRITDSVYPFHDKHAVFRIELEYGDGLLKWVIYRELKDFVNLHAHYRVANIRQGIDKFPTFPKTSLPYMNWLKSEGRGQVGRAEFSKAQRDVLESYLLKLLRATMFGPGANRLCKFLEISAMSVMLAPVGGEQGKQGYLRIMSSGASRRKEQGFHPFSWKSRHEPKWFVVRDSYIVAVDDPASTKIYEVFMIDSTFELERPKRMYRQGLNLFHHPHDSDSENEDPSGAPKSQNEKTDPLLAAEPTPQGHRGAGDPLDPSSTNVGADSNEMHDSSNHTFYLKSSERRLRLVAKTERQQDQFIASIEKMVAKTIWAGKNRFESFAPIRLNASAQWLIDGRDYFWSLSRAIMLAKTKIYIHDWWLSPELYLHKWRLDKLLQRKAREGVQIFVIVYKEVSNDFTPVDSNYTKTRLRALHKNIHIQRSPSHTSTGTLLWSHHEKMCVIDETIGFMGGLDLCFGRWDTPGHTLIDDGPNALDEKQGQSLSPEERESSQIWPGKDYANSRVVDFHTLNKPEEDMYDRAKVPRQPWHDIGLQIIGQPARDLCRHFIQRWNYLLRTKNHTVEMPFLLPAPEFTPHQLQEQRITGTCEVQICRSVGPWSMGISHVEHSIQNAYCKAIQLSDHFVYIENQFFITSTEVNGTPIENKIGDALVSRILRAHTEGTAWRAIIIIPLVPGYPFPIDHSDAGSVRNIMECQNRTISRGDHSIFARLRREGIDPDEYITFFSLRGWGKLSTGALTTEAVYIHAKAMIVDDRTVIIGSANINERSQRGDRDSELACVVRDTDMMDSTMGGKPYKVGRFAHTMRVRLMREHLGVDVDELEAADPDSDLLDRRQKEEMKPEDAWDPDHEQNAGQDRPSKAGHTFNWAMDTAKTVTENSRDVANGAMESAALGIEKGAGAIAGALKVGKDDAEGATKTQVAEDEQTPATKRADGEEPMKGFASTVVPTMEEKVMAEERPHRKNTEPNGVKSSPTKDQKERKDGPALDPPRSDAHSSASTPSDADQLERNKGEATTQSGGLDDTRKIDMSEAASTRVNGEHIKPLAPITEGGEETPPRIHDDAPPPDVENAVKPKGSPLASLGLPSGRNRSSSTVSATSGDSRADGSERGRANEAAASKNRIAEALRRNLREKASAYNIPVPAPIVDPHGFADPLTDKFFKEVWMAAAVRNTQAYRKVFRCVPDDLVLTWKQYREFGAWAERHNKAPKNVVPPGEEAPHSDPAHHSGQHGSGGGGSGGGSMGQGTEGEAPPVETMYKTNTRAGRTASVSQSEGGRRAASGSAAGEGHDHEEGFPAWERDQMEDCLNEVLGHLVIYPTRFLEAESEGGNFLFSKDRLPPLAIYD
ncbi:hypothetical protein RQP46_007494 [Phenoliferia psychrophenolica]